jgi:hypothetical protein
VLKADAKYDGHGHIQTTNRSQHGGFGQSFGGVRRMGMARTLGEQEKTVIPQCIEQARTHRHTYSAATVCVASTNDLQRANIEPENVGEAQANAVEEHGLRHR